MTVEKRRKLRMLLTACAWIGLPATGFAWALPNGDLPLYARLALTLAAAGCAVAAEILSSAAETDLAEGGARLETALAECDSQKTRFREMDRLIEILSAKNSELQGEIVISQVRLQQPAADPQPSPGRDTQVPNPAWLTRRSG